nr:unnamed protein product [Callosobruchus chinensis]
MLQKEFLKLHASQKLHMIPAELPSGGNATEVNSGTDRENPVKKLNVQARLGFEESWTDVYEAKTATAKVEAFLNIFMFHFNNSFPIREIHKVNKTKTKLMIPELYRLKDLLLLYHHNYKHNSSEENKRLYTECKQRYDKLLKDTKIAYNKNVIMNSDNKAKAVWNVINKEVGRNKHKKNNTDIDADTFNNFFVHHAENIAKKCKTTNNLTTNCIKTECSSMFISAVTVTDVYQYFKRLKNKKTEDLYEIGTSLLKECAIFITQPVAEIINTCFREGCFPDALKMSKVLPIHKKGNLNSVENFRQIHITPSLAKVVEYAILDQLVAYIIKVHSHNTRNKNNLMQPRGRIEKTKLIGIDLYNLLPLSITNLPINLFERKIKTVLKQLAPYSINDFKIHLKDNAGLWHIDQLRKQIL